jgi:hypothetical protein
MSFRTRCRIKNAIVCVVYKDSEGRTEYLYVGEDGIPWFPITYTGYTKDMYMWHPSRGKINITPSNWMLQRGDIVRLTDFRKGR